MRHRLKVIEAKKTLTTKTAWVLSDHYIYVAAMWFLKFEQSVNFCLPCCIINTI